MKHLQELSNKVISDFTRDIKVLQEMQSIDWEKLPIDTPVMVCDFLTGISQVRKTGISYFAGLGREQNRPFKTFCNGKTSLNGSDCYCYSFCLPLTNWKELFGEPA